VPLVTCQDEYQGCVMAVVCFVLILVALRTEAVHSAATRKLADTVIQPLKPTTFQAVLKLRKLSYYSSRISFHGSSLPRSSMVE
jgi:hypothetical protein